MPKVQLPYTFKTKDEQANRRQDSEDRYFDEMQRPPREFNGDGVLVTVNAPGGGVVALVHSLGFKANGWLLRRVQLPAGSVTGPRLPFYRPDLRNTTAILELYFTNPGTYDFLVF